MASKAANADNATISPNPRVMMARPSCHKQEIQWAYFSETPARKATGVDAITSGMEGLRH